MNQNDAKGLAITLIISTYVGCILFLAYCIYALIAWVFNISPTETFDFSKLTTLQSLIILPIASKVNINLAIFSLILSFLTVTSLFGYIYYRSKNPPRSKWDYNY